MDTRRIAAFLDFAEVPAEELEELAGAVSEVEVEAGAKVITLDDYGTAIYFIEDGYGYADVLDDGGEATNSVGPGDAFGEIGLLLTGQRTATVVASTPMRYSRSRGKSSTGSEPMFPASNSRCAGSASNARLVSGQLPISASVAEIQLWTLAVSSRV